MAAILGAILKLPPLKQVMASQQMKSSYLERLLTRHRLSHRNTEARAAAGRRRETFVAEGRNGLAVGRKACSML